MERKHFILFGVTLGSFIGGYAPSLWAASPLDISGVICTAIGGVIGTWVAYKITA